MKCGALPHAPPEAAFEKAPLDSRKTFGAGEDVAEWWRTLTEVKCGYSHVRKRQVPPRPCRFAPMFPLRTEGKMLVGNSLTNHKLKYKSLKSHLEHPNRVRNIGAKRQG